MSDVVCVHGVVRAAAAPAAAAPAAAKPLTKEEATKKCRAVRVCATFLLPLDLISILLSSSRDLASTQTHKHAHAHTHSHAHTHLPSLCNRRSSPCLPAQLEKKLRQIDAIKKEDPSTWVSDQALKVASEPALRAELAALEAIVRA
jgi:hypothetical protein